MDSLDIKEMERTWVKERRSLLEIIEDLLEVLTPENVDAALGDLSDDLRARVLDFARRQLRRYDVILADVEKDGWDPRSWKALLDWAKRAPVE